MATPSTDVKTQNPATAEPTNEADQTAAAEPTKPASLPSVFVNSEPIRPEQVENAVKFLSHPKVRGSPVMYRRSFLEKKGLTKEEIDEAFLRVPDSSPTVQAATINQDAQTKTVSNAQTQAPVQAQQPAAAAPAGVISRTISQPRFHWSHAIYAIGILAVSGAGTAVIFKNAVVPRLKSWIRKIASEDENGVAQKTDSKPSVAEEAAAAAKAAADAAAQVAKVSQEMMNTNIEEKRYFRNLTDMLDVQLREMRAMSFSIRKLEEQNNMGALPSYNQDYRVSSSKQQPYANGKAEFDSLSGRSSSPPAPAEPSVPPHPKSYMEIMAMVQRGEKPPNVKDIDDSPPNPHQPISNSRVDPRSKAPNSSGPYQLNGDSDQGNGDPSIPWWQRKNVRITEVENEEDSKVGQYYSSGAPEQPARSSWVPPQPPPIAMAEAAEAIRRPKPAVQKEQQSSDDQSVAEPSDELQRITKISETGGAALNTTNGIASETSPSEIQEEQEQNY
ncbi:hypothetical protein CDL15_Pgr009039 [Punica granatum]|uniref:Peroxisomal membrane protein PEX14 n=1 Tax=Punica granatum TaxID=22663 RepID=A0A218VYW5_PUNGR|nr:hypothetical protein CDL15_Pgr009039 [Punica granatum]